MGNIKTAFDKDQELKNLLFDNFFANAIDKCQQGWRKVIATATVYGIPIPCLSTGKIITSIRIELIYGSCF